MTDKYRITEGVHGYWSYHLSTTGPRDYTQGLCGANTMQTSMRLEQWGVPGGDHLPKKYTYCKECALIEEEDDSE